MSDLINAPYVHIINENSGLTHKLMNYELRCARYTILIFADAATAQRLGFGIRFYPHINRAVGDLCAGCHSDDQLWPTFRANEATFEEVQMTLLIPDGYEKAAGNAKVKPDFKYLVNREWLMVPEGLVGQRVSQAISAVIRPIQYAANPAVPVPKKPRFGDLGVAIGQRTVGKAPEKAAIAGKYQPLITDLIAVATSRDLPVWVSYPVESKKVGQTAASAIRKDFSRQRPSLKLSSRTVDEITGSVLYLQVSRRDDAPSKGAA